MTRNILFMAALGLLVSCGGKEDSPSSIAKQNLTVDTIAVKEVVAIGKIEPEKGLIDIASPSDGIVTDLYKQEGDSIKAGELIAQLDASSTNLKVADLNEQYRAQQSQVQLEEASLRETMATYTNQQRKVTVAKDLVAKGAELKDNLDDALMQLKASEAQVEKGKAGVQVAQAKLLVLKEQIKLAAFESSQKQIRAPYTGVLLTVPVKKGNAMKQYETLATLAPDGAVIVRAEVDELFSSRLKLGQEVSIRYVGNTTLIAKGKLIYMASYLKKKSIFSERADDQEDRRVREIKISLDTKDNLLLSSKVECTIKL